MMSNSGVLRFLITLVLAVTVPFCCCKLAALFSACGGCQGSAETLTVLGDQKSVGHAHGDGSRAHHVAKPMYGFGKLASNEGDHSPTTCGPGSQDRGDCACGKHDTKMLAEVKPSAEVSAPVLLAVSAWPALTPPGLDFPTCVQSRLDWTQNRPPTSLLRLHCALIV